MDLKDKIVLITGATGGIGNSLVKKFYDLGSKIIATELMMKTYNSKTSFPNIDIKKFNLKNMAK